MTEHALPPGYLGPATEARFASVFATRAVVDRRAAADLLGLDPKTLDGLADAKAIRTVPKGAHRGYTERELRAYLLDPPESPCSAPKANPRPKSQATNVRVVNFSERKRGR